MQLHLTYMSGLKISAVKILNWNRKSRFFVTIGQDRNCDLC